MDINAKTVSTFGYISISIMLIMLALLWSGIVPDAFRIPFFAIAIALFILRVILRLRLARMERQALKAKHQPQTRTKS